MYDIFTLNKLKKTKYHQILFFYFNLKPFEWKMLKSTFLESDCRLLLPINKTYSKWSNQKASSFVGYYYKSRIFNKTHLYLLKFLTESSFKNKVIMDVVLLDETIYSSQLAINALSTSKYKLLTSITKTMQIYDFNMFTTISKLYFHESIFSSFFFYNTNSSLIYKLLLNL